jgi:hypothetical protein
VRGSSFFNCVLRFFIDYRLCFWVSAIFGRVFMCIAGKKTKLTQFIELIRRSGTVHVRWAVDRLAIVVDRPSHATLMLLFQSPWSIDWQEWSIDQVSLLSSFLLFSILILLHVNSVQILFSRFMRGMFCSFQVLLVALLATETSSLRGFGEVSSKALKIL